MDDDGDHERVEVEQHGHQNHGRGDRQEKIENLVADQRASPESPNEREQVEAQGDNPKQRGRSDVGRYVSSHRNHQTRRNERKPNPFQEGHWGDARRRDGGDGR